MTWRVDKKGKIKLYTRRQVKKSRPIQRKWGQCEQCKKKFPTLKHKLCRLHHGQFCKIKGCRANEAGV